MILLAFWAKHPVKCIKREKAIDILLALHVGVGKDFTKPQRNVSMKFFLVLASSFSLSLFFFGHSNEKNFPGLQISPVSLGNRSWRPGPAGG